MKFKQLVVFGLMLFISSSAKAASSNEFIVEDIRIEGLQRVALGAALTYLPFTVGDEMNTFRISQLIRSMYSSSHFENIQIFRDGNTLLVRVTERPTISYIVFEDNDDRKDEQLQSSLNEANNLMRLT